MPDSFRRRVIDLSSQGKSPEPLFKFWDRLQQNPSKRSVDQLFPFLEKEGIPITNDGCFLAYKGVRADYMDQHSGTICNKPGSVITVPRNSVSDDPREACHFGLHVGSERYAGNFAPKQVICKVKPENVVCVPYDHSSEKMRVCEYEVIGNKGDRLPSDLFEDDSLQTVRNEDVNVDEVVEEEIDATPQAVKHLDEDKQATAPRVTAKRVEKRIDKRKFEKFKGLNTKQLMDFSIDDLRQYATYGLEVVGASKIPGGKAALIARILKARRK